MASHKNPTFQPTLVEKSLAGHNISTNSCRKITGRPNIALAGPTLHWPAQHCTGRPNISFRHYQLDQTFSLMAQTSHS